MVASTEMKIALTLSFLLAFVVGCAATERIETSSKDTSWSPPPDLAESLVQSSWINLNEMTSGDSTRQKEALQEGLPDKADLDVLFGDSSPQVWAILEPIGKRLLDFFDEGSVELSRPGTIQKFEAFSIRDGIDSRFAPVLKMIPKEIPAYRTVTHLKGRMLDSSTYLFVNERWIWIHGLEEIPSLLRKDQ